jgi:hypothetical protein
VRRGCRGDSVVLKWSAALLGGSSVTCGQFSASSEREVCRMLLSGVRGVACTGS